MSNRNKLKWRTFLVGGGVTLLAGAALLLLRPSFAGVDRTMSQAASHQAGSSWKGSKSERRQSVGSMQARELFTDPRGVAEVAFGKAGDDGGARYREVMRQIFNRNPERALELLSEHFGSGLRIEGPTAAHLSDVVSFAFETDDLNLLMSLEESISDLFGLHAARRVRGAFYMMYARSDPTLAFERFENGESAELSPSGASTTARLLAESDFERALELTMAAEHSSGLRTFWLYGLAEVAREALLAAGESRAVVITVQTLGSLHEKQEFLTRVLQDERLRENQSVLTALMDVLDRAESDEQAQLRAHIIESYPSLQVEAIDALFSISSYDLGSHEVRAATRVVVRQMGFQEALEWAVDRRGGEGRVAAIQEVARMWLATDAMAAGGVIANWPGGRVRDELVGELVRYLCSHRSVEEGKEWLDEIGDDKVKRAIVNEFPILK